MEGNIENIAPEITEKNKIILKVFTVDPSRIKGFYENYTHASNDDL